MPRRRLLGLPATMPGAGKAWTFGLLGAIVQDEGPTQRGGALGAAMRALDAERRGPCRRAQPEARATLLSRRGNEGAQGAFSSWLSPASLEQAAALRSARPLTIVVARRGEAL